MPPSQPATDRSRSHRRDQASPRAVRLHAQSIPARIRPPVVTRRFLCAWRTSMVWVGLASEAKSKPCPSLPCPLVLDREFDHSNRSVVNPGRGSWRWFTEWCDKGSLAVDDRYRPWR